VNKQMTFEMKPIGVIHSPFTSAEGTPIQPVTSGGAEGYVEVFPEYREGLQDLSGFARVWLIYFCDRSRLAQMKVVPYRDSVERGLFATRAPSRPNPIGMSAVRLLRIEGLTLFIRDVDIIDRTPLLDIKPYVPKFDVFGVSRVGWYSNVPDSQNAVKRFTS